MGDIARHIYSALEWDQPSVALGAAITFVAALKSKRVVNQFNIAPNIYAALVVLSGTGKSQAQHLIQTICEESQSHKLLMGKPKSASGILDAFVDENRQFLIWDEFGIALSALSKSKSSHEAMILSEMMDLFSSANRVYIGGAYSKKTTPTRQDISKPHLSVLGASTPNRFYGALNQDFIHDGFLTRWLIFESGEAPKGKDSNPLPTPTHIIEQISQINIGESHPPTSLQNIITKKTTLIEFKVKPKGYLEIFQRSVKDKIEDCPTEIHRVFYSRLFEHTIKLCTVFEENGICNHETFVYCRDLAKYLVDNAISVCDKRIFDSQLVKTESDLRDRILGILKVGQSIDKSSLARKIQHWGSSYDRKNIINDILESETWIQSKHENRTTYSRIV